MHQGPPDPARGLHLIASALQRLDLVEIHAVQNDLGRVQATQTAFDDFVDLAVIRDGRFPAHAADEAEGFHGAMKKPKNFRS